MSSNKVSVYAWLIMLFLSLVWGSSFILIKKSLTGFTPVQLACVRISISSIAFIPLLLKNIKEVNWKKWPLFLLVGLTGSGLPSFLYAFAQTEISSSVTGLLNSMTPIFTLVLGVLFFKVIFSGLKFAGVILGLIGSALLIFLEDGSVGSNNLFYSLLVIFGTICYAISGNVVKEYFRDTRSIIISSVSFFMIGPPAIIYALNTGIINHIATTEGILMPLAAVFTLSLLGTVLAIILFYKLVKDTDAVFASSVAYFMPVVALMWGFLDGESLGIYHFLGLAFILFGVYIIKRN